MFNFHFHQVRLQPLSSFSFELFELPDQVFGALKLKFKDLFLLLLLRVVPELPELAHTGRAHVVGVLQVLVVRVRLAPLLLLSHFLWKLKILAVRILTGGTENIRMLQLKVSSADLLLFLRHQPRVLR